MSAWQKTFLEDVSGRVPQTSAARAHVFTAPPNGAIEDRWHIYSSGYFIRIHGVLADEFKAIATILGDDAFAALIARYLHACPPATHDLGDVGAHLADFLSRDTLAAPLPFLSDLACLERAVAECFIARDGGALDVTAVSVLTPAALADLPLTLLPGTQLLHSVWPLHALWRCRDQDAAGIDIALDTAPGCVIVYRHAWRVRVGTLNPETADVLAALRASPSTLAQLQAQSLWKSEAGAARLITAFRELLDLGVLAEAESCSQASMNSRTLLCEQVA